MVSAASLAYIANRPQFPEPIQFGSLPGTTFSHNEELLPEQVVAAAYIEHLGNPSRGFTDWRNFVDEYIDVSAQPNHLEYCRTVLERALVPAGEEDLGGLGGLRGNGACLTQLGAPPDVRLWVGGGVPALRKDLRRAQDESRVTPSIGGATESPDPSPAHVRHSA